MGRTRISPSLLSPKMYLIVFSCVAYSRLKAFGKKRENKTHGKGYAREILLDKFFRKPVIAKVYERQGLCLINLW